MKRCFSCEETLPLLAFSPAPSKRYGVQSSCKACRRVLVAAWQWDNPDKVRTANRIWTRKNAAKNRSKVRQWRANNPEKRRAGAWKSEATRRARKNGAFVESVNRQFVYERDGGICQICHKPVDPVSFHVDHIQPLSKGGEHSLANVQLAHPRCNVLKGAKYGRAA